MTKRETRVINAFINCVKHGEYTVDYAITLIEDNQRYGWLSEDAKEVFYNFLDEYEAEQEEPVEEIEEDPEEPVVEIPIEIVEENGEPVEEE